MKKTILISIVFILLLTACGSKDLDVTKTKKDKFGDLSYEIPEAFTKESIDMPSDSELVFSDYRYAYHKIGSNGKYDDSCSLDLFYDSEFTDYTLEKYADIYQEGKTGTRKTINGVEWLIIKDEVNEKMTDYYYYVKYNNRFYELSYSDWGSGSLCKEALTAIEETLKFE